MSYQSKKYFQRLLPYLALGGGALDVLFWIFYFAKVIVPSEADEALVRGFESAFPFADGLMGIMLVCAGIGLLKKKPSGTFFIVAAAAMAVYLGLLDVTFYSRQGLYLPLTFASLCAILINASCIAGGAVGLWLGWKIWRMNDAILKISARPSDHRDRQRQRHWRRDRALVGASRS